MSIPEAFTLPEEPKEEASPEWREGDTIPQELKKHFFTDKSMPHLLDYDAIGFDVDNAFCKYKVKPCLELTVRSYFAYLVAGLGYPEDVKEFDYEKNLNICLNYSVWDVKNGTILQLIEGKEIANAIRGFQSLSQEEIHQLYGNPPIFKDLVWPQSEKSLENIETANWTNAGYQRTCHIPVICQVVDMI